VNLSRNTIVVPLAALMLMGAAGAVLATAGSPAAPGTQAPAAATPTPAPSSGTTTGPNVRNDLLSGVLDDLVAKGTITAAQKQAIVDALTAERTAQMEARKAAMEKAKADLQQIRGFVSDGVITKEEFDQLPADSQLRTLTTLMDDGQITSDELKALGRGLGGGLFGGRFPGDGHGFRGGWGGGMPKDGAVPSASPTTAG
jgi:polyhydroxyalkanoate synthesis regulator phasin